MRKIMLSAVFALGVGLVGSTAASAATTIPNATMIDKAAQSTSIVEKAYCRAWRHCWWRHGRRYCEVHRRCW